jgi:UDP-N-acetylmuramyl pentapeptide phosphotransferase/UDP-N-acetylglucosamine-1-phosphate transferase/glycosyltransferase involved in cell wall biosynthesis
VLTLVAIVISGLAMLAAVPVLMLIATQMGMMTVPITGPINAVPKHRATFRGGGLALAIVTVICGIVFLAYLHLQEYAINFDHWLPLLVGSLVMAMVGFADDVIDVSGKMKLLCLLGIGIMLTSTGLKLQGLIDTTSYTALISGLSLVVTLALITGSAVSMNFIDGLDGLATSIGIVAASVLMVVALYAREVDLALVSGTLIGACLAFLIFNHHPARITLGDSGSMFLGVMLGGLMLVAATRESIGLVKGVVLPLSALSIPILDAGFTLLRRSIVDRRSLFSPEESHIHHRLLKMGVRPPHVLLILLTATIVCTLLAAIAHHFGSWTWLSMGMLYALIMAGLFRTAGSVRAREMLKALKRNRQVYLDSLHYRRQLDQLTSGFRSVTTFEAWWAQVCELARRLDAVRVVLPVVTRDGTAREWVYNNARYITAAARPKSTLQAMLPIPQRRKNQPLSMSIELAIKDNLENAGERLALITRVIGDYGLDRLEATPNKLASSEFSRSVALNPQGVASTGVDLPPKSTATLVPAPPQESAVDEPQAPVDHVTGSAMDESIDIGPRPPRVAIVHDFLYTYAGAERVLEQMVAVWPNADLFSLFDFIPPEKRGFIRNKEVKTSFVQRLPFASTKHRLYLPLMPLAIEQLDLSGYDIVLTSSYLAAKGVITKPNQLHVCYCHSPARYAWDLQEQYLGTNNITSGIKSLLARVILHYIRTWDVRSSNGVDHFLTNSNFIARRVEKCYRRHADTIYPPIDVSHFRASPRREDFYFALGRLVPYKRNDVLVEAFNQMPDKQLVIVGDGPELERLKAKAKPNVKLMGFQTQEQVRHYLSLCKGFVFAAEEDFGIVLVEAQASGAPAIAFGSGGAKEIVIDGQTGLFFDQQTPASVVAAVQRFESRSWDHNLIVKSVERFSAERFRSELEQFVNQRYAEFLDRGRGPLRLSIGLGHVDSDDDLVNDEFRLPQSGGTQ